MSITQALFAHRASQTRARDLRDVEVCPQSLPLVLVLLLCGQIAAEHTAPLGVLFPGIVDTLECYPHCPGFRKACLACREGIKSDVVCPEAVPYLLAWHKHSSMHIRAGQFFFPCLLLEAPCAFDQTFHQVHAKVNLRSGGYVLTTKISR